MQPATIEIYLSIVNYIKNKIKFEIYNFKDDDNCMSFMICPGIPIGTIEKFLSTNKKAETNDLSKEEMSLCLDFVSKCPWIVFGKSGYDSTSSTTCAITYKNERIDIDISNPNFFNLLDKIIDTIERDGFLQPVL